MMDYQTHQFPEACTNSMQRVELALDHQEFEWRVNLTAKNRRILAALIKLFWEKNCITEIKASPCGEKERCNVGNSSKHFIWSVRRQSFKPTIRITMRPTLIFKPSIDITIRPISFSLNPYHWLQCLVCDSGNDDCHRNQIIMHSNAMKANLLSFI